MNNLRQSALIAVCVLVAACSGSGGGAAPGDSAVDAIEPGAPTGNGVQKNTAPLAVGDVAVQAGGVMTLPVLLNDSDPDHDPLFISSIGQPQHGSAEEAAGMVVYTPGGDFLGSDEFTYTIDDGRGGTASTTVRISAALDAPRLTPDSVTVAPGSTVTIPVLANDVDPTGGELRVTSIQAPVQGSAVVSDNGTPAISRDDTIRYTAADGYVGAVQFAYSAANAAGTALGGVTVNILDPASAAQPVSASGRAVKGPLRGATVSLYALDPNGLPRQPAIAQNVTDEGGFWSAPVPSDHGPLLVVSDGGEYSDEADPGPSGGQLIRLQTGETLTGVLPAGETVATVSVFTDALYRKSLFETQGDNFAAVFAGNRADATTAFGFDPVSTTPADPANPEVDMDEHSLRYALALGGAANIINEMAVYVGLDAPTYAVIRAFAEDFAECVLNGQGLGGPLSIVVDEADVALPSALNLNAAIVRFRNNLADRYGTLLTQVDVPTCSRPGFLPDATPPVFIAAPGPVTVNALSAAGTPSTNPSIASILSAPRAVDDRDGNVAVSNDAPALFAPGVTTITFVAADAGGNRAELAVPVTVSDLSPPALSVPADITVPQSGRFTAVSIGSATATDNVSSAADITISNNAPAGGFAPGTTTVIWSAVDQAGLASTALQMVSVTSTGAPVLVTPLPDLASTENFLFQVTLADAFDVSGGSSPGYALAGLPAGSGLALDASTGILRGRPNRADVMAGPLTLTFTASNSNGSAADTFVLVVNAAPSDADLSLNLTVDNPTPVPGDIVTFSLNATNAGPGDADSVVIDGFDGTGYHLLSASGAFDYERFTWTVGTIAAGDSASLIVQAEVKSAGNYRMAAEISASLQHDPDSAPANGVVSEDDYAAVTTSPAGGEPDADSDGLSDADELTVYLTDPDNPDSDADGVEDRIEVLVAGDGSLANSPATRVIFVDANAAGSGDGSGWGQALRTTAELLPLLGSGTAGDPVYLLLSAADNARYAPFTLTHDHVVIAGADATGRPLVPGRGVATFDAQGADSPALILSSTDRAFLVNLLLTGGQPSDEGGGLRIVGASDVVVDNSLIAGNDAGTDGGGFSVASSASLTLSNSRVLSNTADGIGGGGGYVEGVVNIRNSIFADNIQWANSGEAGGGGLALQSNSTSSVADSMFLSNFSADDGGAIYANRIRGDAILHNNLIAGNANANGYGGGVHAEVIRNGWSILITSSTIVWNQTVTELSGRTHSGGIDFRSNVDNAIVRDNILWHNSDADNTLESSDNYYDRSGGSVLYNNVAGYAGAGSDGNIDADPVFLEGFYLHQGSSGSLNAGSTSAAAAGLDTYSTAVSGAHDSGTVDQGFHYSERTAGIADNVEMVAAYCRDLWVSENVHLVFRPKFGAKPLGAGHKVAVLQTAGPGTGLLSVTAHEPAGAGSALAADQGDGTYRVLLANAGLSGTVTLSVIVDDVGGGAISQDLSAVDVGSCDVDSGRERFIKRYPWLATPF